MDSEDNIALPSGVLSLFMHTKAPFCSTRTHRVCEKCLECYKNSRVKFWDRKIQFFRKVRHSGAEKHTIRSFIRIISKTQPELSDLH